MQLFIKKYYFKKFALPQSPLRKKRAAAVPALSTSDGLFRTTEHSEPNENQCFYLTRTVLILCQGLFGSLLSWIRSLAAAFFTSTATA